MPPKSQTDLVREHGEQLAKFDQRIDHFQKSLDRIEANLLELRKAHMEVQTQATITVKNVERIEKKSDESQKSRRDVFMLLLGAIISAVIGLTGKWIEINIFKKGEAGDKR